MYEQKIYAQIDWFLSSTFGSPFGEEYYTGDWMLGPDMWCWQHGCWQMDYLGVAFDNVLKGLQDRSSTLDDFLSELDALAGNFFFLLEWIYS